MPRRSNLPKARRTPASLVPQTAIGIAATEAERGDAIAMEIKTEATATGAGVEGIIETAVITEVTAAMGVGIVTTGTGAPVGIVDTAVQGRGTEIIRAKHGPHGGAK